MAAVRILLLVAAVATAVTRPRGWPAWVGPVVFTAVAFALGATTGSLAGKSLRPLTGALAFLLAAVPLASLLDRAGSFEAVAESLVEHRRLVGGLFALAALATAVLNLDAAVVLLTPLYVRVSRRAGLPAWYLGAQPLVLSFLASSFLPVSNLTNLVAVGQLHLGVAAFVEHLGPPSLAACAVGYVLFRRWGARRGAGDRPGSLGSTATDSPPSPRRDSSPGAGGRESRRALLLGAGVVAVLLVGFLAGPSAGIAPWEVVAALDLVLAVGLRSVPIRAVPVGTALVAGGLAILSGAAARHIGVSSLLQGTGVLASARTAAVAAGGANLVNNLPAFLVGLAHLGHARAMVWPLLLGANMGPSLLVTGSLAALLWRRAMASEGEGQSALAVFRLALEVILPAALAGIAVLCAMTPLFGT